MPMGQTHRAINTVMSVPFAGVMLAELHRPILEVAFFVGGYTFATFFMNPDLDLAGDGYRSWGILRFYWWPYQKALAHRSFLSHFPVISTLARIVYLLWLPVLLIFLLGASVRSYARETVFDWVPELAPYLVALVLGMMCSDTLHLILDLTSTRLKRTFGGGHRRHESFLEHHGEGRHYTGKRKERRQGWDGNYSRSRR